MSKKRGGFKSPLNFLEGRVEILAYKKGVLFDHQVYKNIILYQGLAEVIRAITSSPVTTPRVITRVAIGDQGTVPADPTVPKVPVKTMTALYHEVYRKDADEKTQTLYSPVGYSYTGTTQVGSDNITNMSSTAGLTAGVTVTGTGIPLGAVVVQILTPTSIQISAPATSSNVGISISFDGSINECQFVATFNAIDVDLTAFSNPSQPRINEVGLVIIDPTTSAGPTREPITSPTPPEEDEIVLSIRTFKSVPFDADNDISVTIRYTLFAE